MRIGLILASALIAFAVQPASAGIGRVKKAVGKVIVERGGKELPVTPGFILEKGDMISTGKGGRVGVTFNDNSRFSAGQYSQISIPEFNFDDTTHQGEFITNVDKGAVAIISGQIAHSAKDAMKVRTPTALLGVRGTRFVVEVR